MTNDNINLRNKVLNMLLEIDDKKQSHIVLKETLDSLKHLEKNQRAFVTRLFRGTIERQIELDYIIDAFSKTPTGKMKKVIKYILRMSVYQLKYMDSVPVSAVCNEAVKLTAKRKFNGLKGFVNGVLRNIANNIKTTAHPKNPNSSANIENIKSLCGSGMYKYFCLLSPSPTPNSPPEPIAYKLWITCQPLSVASFQGSKNVTNLSSLYGENAIAANKSGDPAPNPVSTKCLNLHPATIIIIHTIPTITIEALKCGSNINNAIKGATIQICFTKPFQK